MAGRAWCCGGGSGGGSGGPATVVVEDTATVDLEGDGSSAAPITASVIVAPEPNGLEAATSGLLVAPSADTGNTLAVGSDGRLFVPASSGGGTTTVTGVAGGAPAPVGTARSVDVDVAPDGAGGFQVGARLSPAWAESGQAGFNYPGPDIWVPGPTLTIPETGVYHFDATVWGQLNVVYSRTSDNRIIWAGLAVDGAVIKSAIAVNNSWTVPGGANISSQGAATLTHRQALNAGQTISVYARYNGDAPQTGDGHGASGWVGFHKISD